MHIILQTPAVQSQYVRPTVARLKATSSCLGDHLPTTARSISFASCTVYIAAAFAIFLALNIIEVLGCKHSASSVARRTADRLRLQEHSEMAVLTKLYVRKYSEKTAAALCHVTERPSQETSSCLYADCMGGQTAAWCMPRQAGCMIAPSSTAGLHTTTSCTSWPTLAVDICPETMRITLPSFAWLELMTGTLFQQVAVRCMHKSVLLDCFSPKDFLPCC
jgi:hypothetical protein